MTTPGSLVVGSLDGETCRFRPGFMSPIPVCFSWADTEGVEFIATWRDIAAAVRYVLERADYVVGVNFAYDAAVLIQWFPELRELVWQAYADGRFLDLGVIERLGQIATGQPQQDNSLGMLSLRYGLGKMDKSSGGPRTNYGPLFGLPLECYPDAHRDYALNDVRVAVEIFRRQMQRYQACVPLALMQEETYNKFWAALTSYRGLRTDQVAYDELETYALARLEQLTELAKARGFVREDGSQNKAAIQAAVLDAYEGAPPMTTPAKDREEQQARKRAALEARIADPATDPKERIKAERALARLKPFEPQISTAKTTLKGSGNEELEALSAWGEIRSVVNKDLKLLRNGLTMPIHTRFGLADTLRTTTSKPNIQNFGRNGGARECITARHDQMPGVTSRVDIPALLERYETALRKHATT